ncbi:MAG: NosD domain-containing protein [Methanobacteriota archaeon]
MRSITPGIVCFMLVTSSISFFVVNSDSTKGTIIYVNDDNTAGPWDGSLDHPYRLIQEGINSAQEGDRIYVFTGTYHENLVIGKNRIQLVGEDQGTTIIQNPGTLVTITAHNVTMESFSMCDASTYGLYVVNTQDVTIRDCTIQNCYMFGVYVKNSSRCVLVDVCSHHNHRYGVYVWKSRDCTLTRCTSYDNDNQNYHDHGFVLFDVQRVTITECTSYNNYYGFYLDYSDNCSMSRCVAYGNAGYGIHFYDTDDTVASDCETHDNLGFGFFLELSDYCSIMNSQAYRTNTGILLYHSTNDTIVNNTVHNNSWAGIQIRDLSNDNVVFGCTVHHNREGVMVFGSIHNLVYHNNIFLNMENGYDDCLNTWNLSYPDGGNYWGDYTGDDTDEDGIGDTSYTVGGAGSYDFYPFMEQNRWVNIAPQRPERPEGSSMGRTNTEYWFHTVTMDRENDPVYYQWSWGDGTTSDWVGPYNSDFDVSLSHEWTQLGFYQIKVKAKDNRDQESEWSESLLFNINGFEPQNIVIDSKNPETPIQNPGGPPRDPR